MQQIPPLFTSFVIVLSCFARGAWADSPVLPPLCCKALIKHIGGRLAKQSSQALYSACTLAHYICKIIQIIAMQLKLDCIFSAAQVYYYKGVLK